MQALGAAAVYREGLRVLGYPPTWVMTPGEARPLIEALQAPGG